MTDEIRCTPMAVECRGGRRLIGGYALQYNSRSRPMGGFVEQVAPGFTDRAAAQGYRGMVARYAHRDEYLLGAVDNRNLTLTNDTRGLQYAVEVPDYHDWIYQSVKRGDLRSSSFAFNNTEDEWTYEDDVPLRTLLSADLFEVGPTPIGQYEDATCALRSLAAHCDAPLSDVEQRAQSGQLATFFTRSDRPADKTMNGRLAWIKMLELKPLSGRMAMVRTLEQYQPTQTLSGAQAEQILTQMSAKTY